MIRIVAKAKPWDMSGKIHCGLLPSLDDVQIFDEGGKDITSAFTGPIEIVIRAGEPIVAKLTAIVAELDVAAVEVPT